MGREVRARQRLLRSIAQVRPLVRKHCMAILELERWGPQVSHAVPSLVEDLANQHPLIRWCAAIVLGAIGPDAAASVPALIEALRDRWDDVRWASADALASIGAHAAAPALIRELRSSQADTQTRLSVLWALGCIEGGSESRTIAEALAEALKDDDYLVRFLAAWALGNAIGSVRESGIASIALPPLIAAQRSVFRCAGDERLGHRRAGCGDRGGHCCAH